jgi:hypothetical protein
MLKELQLYWLCSNHTDVSELVADVSELVATIRKEVVPQIKQQFIVVQRSFWEVLNNKLSRSSGPADDDIIDTIYWQVRRKELTDKDLSDDFSTLSISNSRKRKNRDWEQKPPHSE